MNIKPGALLHQAFLERASNTDTPGAGDLGLGAFLTLRMVDQFRIGAQPNADALNYQVRATLDFVSGLSSDTAEVNHLRQIARVGEQVLKRQEPRFLWAPMLAYGFWLEGELRLAESLDVLDTALGLNPDGESNDHVAALLLRGRVLRHLSRYTEATASYTASGAMGKRLGDDHSERLGRIGCAIVMQKLGNLAAADESLRQVRHEAQAAGDRNAEARACHDIADGLYLMGRSDEGVAFAFHAYEVYEQRVDKLKALSDVGVLMKAIGNYHGAEDAFMVVLDGEPTALVRLNTVLELLELGTCSRDRVAFERWRRELEAGRSLMPPDAHVDYEIKLGSGLAAFGRVARAKEVLESAVRRAEQHRLNKYLFRAEEALAAVGETLENEQRPAPERTQVAEVAEVAEKLQLLRASA
ncbi:MAG TPA: hypothetical protein VGI83_03765 [Gemmatimonadales bacterium]